MLRTRLSAVLLVTGLVACNPRGGAASRESETSTSDAKTTASSSKAAPAVPSSAAWSAIPKLDAARTPAKPVAFPSGSKDKRFLVFGASWCGACVASVVGDAELAHRYKGRLEVAVAIQEENASFTASSMSRWLSDVRVYDQDSTAALAKACHVVGIPAGCLIDGDSPIWKGSPADGAAIIDAFLAGKLDEVLAKEKRADAAWKAAAVHPDKQPEALDALHGFAGQENSIAWDLVDKPGPSDAEVALSIALARDAVDATGALDFAILDTYQLGLSKAGNDAEAVRVAKRVIAVCDAVEGHCSEERARAQKIIAGGR